MEPGNDADAEETHSEVTTEDMPYESPERLTVEDNLALTNDSRFPRYNIYGHILEVTAKYKPPIDVVGEGVYGFVCSIMNTETNEEVAVKKIAYAFADEIDALRTLREIKILRHLKDHDNIMKIKDVILPPERTAFNDVYIASELMDSNLLDLINNDDVELTPAHYQYILYQILRGLKYIHSAGVLHRDLKPNNLLVGLDWAVKICDFGLARGISEIGQMAPNVSARCYSAPELLLYSVTYTKAIDVWAVGCIFLEMVNGKPLFPGDDDGEQLHLLMELVGSPTEEYVGLLHENIKRYLGQFPSFRRQSFSEKFPNVPPLAIDLMEKILTFDHRERITVEEALAHPYFQSMHNIADEPECTTPFELDLGDEQPTEEEFRELIYREALDFNPEYQQG